MWNKYLLYYYTLLNLKWIQIIYRVFYTLKSKLQKIKRFKYNYSTQNIPQTTSLNFSKSISSYDFLLGDKSFKFLNLSHQFPNEIDWNFNEFGKLWTYNLNYFEFLSQTNVTKEVGLNLIYEFINQFHKIKDGIEPFPTSIRIIFWIKFIIKHKIKDPKIDQNLNIQTHILKANLEYHLLGNHLLENGFALLFGACYFNDTNFYTRAKEIISSELNEQILSDGAHFELSPMYHQQILYRLLDCINLLKSNSTILHTELLPFLETKASLMLGWLKAITFQNGDIPLVNDSAKKIAPCSISLFEYAEKINIKPNTVILQECGCRVFRNNHCQIFIDVGEMGPKYIPGHSHSDTFNFIVYRNDTPFIIETGTSTYTKGLQRHIERSTSAHNTVVYNGINQSEVWGGFRVGRRASVELKADDDNNIIASHDGYTRFGVNHTRHFNFQDDYFEFHDKIESNSKGKSVIAHLHFHHDVVVSLDNDIIKTNLGDIHFDGYEEIKITTFKYAEEFNVLTTSKKAEIKFNSDLKTTIYF